MTVDKSLKLPSTLQRSRSVLSRAERLAQLREVGKWREGDSIFGLPKVRVRHAKRRKAAKVEAAGAAAPGAAGAAAPAPTAPAPGAASKEKPGAKEKAAAKK